MTRILERRLRRLEQARGAQDDDELVEVALSEPSPAGRCSARGDPSDDEATAASANRERLASGGSARLV